MQMRFATNLTDKEYVSQRAWNAVQAPACPWCQPGRCELAPHGFYPRVQPAGGLGAALHLPGAGAHGEPVAGLFRGVGERLPGGAGGAGGRTMGWLGVPSGLHPKTIEQCVKNLVGFGISNGVAISPESESFRLLAIGDSNVIEDIHSEGIKSIQLNVGQFKETARDRTERHETLVQRLGREVLSTLFAKDEDRRKVEEAENIHARLIVSINPRKRGLTPEQLAPIGRQLLDASEDEVEIVTKNGKRIRQGALMLKKSVKVRPFAKTVHHNHAWDLMGEYFQELRESGALDQ